LTSTEIELKAQRDLEAKQEINRRLVAMLDNVPGRSEQAGLEMFLQILNATTTDELDRPWNGNGMADFVDKVIVIQSIHQEPSSFKDGPGVFLIGDGYVKETGTVVAFMTSSVYEMAQLLVAHNNNLLPWECIPRVAVKPTENGYYPRHLETYREGYSALSTEPTRPPTRTDPPGYRDGKPLSDVVKNARAKAAAAATGPATFDEGPGF